MKFCERELLSLFFVGFIVVVKEIYTSVASVTLAISELTMFELTMFAFFSLVTVVFLAL